MIHNNEARVNITWGGQNGELPDPVAYDALNVHVLSWVTEAVRAGDVPGIQRDPRAVFDDFVVDRHPANGVRPFNLIQVRPKTPFG